MSLSRRSTLAQALQRTLCSIEEREKLTPDDASLRELKRSIVQTLAELQGREQSAELGAPGNLADESAG